MITLKMKPKAIFFHILLLLVIQMSFPAQSSAKENLYPSVPGDVRYSFVVSMENPGTHYFNVELTCTGQKSEFIDFKMPVWTPGYYGILNHPKHLTGFSARNAKGQTLDHKKTSKNTWRVSCKKEPVVVISYEVYADELSVISSFLDASKAFISPTSVFVFPDGQIDQPSVVRLKPYPGWKTVSTGLDKIEDHVFYASNFDVLFDCPILLGNQRKIDFLIKGIPHTLTFSEKDTLDKTRLISDLTKIVESAATLLGDIPYRHYTFITIDSHGGGLEHSNSCVLSCQGSVADTSNLEDYKGWLSFVAHEYFHLYNVKSIRPIALGPFDYDRENYTNLLWFSEGVTVYYENILLNRAGIFSRDDCFKSLSESIGGFENRPGRLQESASESSFDAWIHFFERNAENRNNTISYYDKGCALGLLLDLKIRHANNNKKSLDDVMRTLYHQYFKTLNRGFTDEEFRSVCEKVAGTSLGEIFTYACTVDPIDYPKYLSLAGIAIDTTSHIAEETVYFGANIRSDDQRCWLASVERNSPAWKAGLGNGNEIEKIEGQTANQDVFASILKSKKPGDTLNLTVLKAGQPVDVGLILAPKTERSFKMEVMDDCSPQAKTLLDSWLK